MLHCHFSIDTVDTISIATEEQLRSDKSHCLCCKCLWLLHFPYCFSCSSTDNGIFLHVMKAGRTFQQIKEKFIQNLKIFRWSICLKLILQRKYLESREERNLKKKISHCDLTLQGMRCEILSFFNIHRKRTLETKWQKIQKSSWKRTSALISK